jgi:hypothetical protein
MKSGEPFLLKSPANRQTLWLTIVGLWAAAFACKTAAIAVRAISNPNSGEKFAFIGWIIVLFILFAHCLLHIVNVVKQSHELDVPGAILIFSTMACIWVDSAFGFSIFAGMMALMTIGLPRHAPGSNK